MIAEIPFKPSHKKGYNSKAHSINEFHSEPEQLVDPPSFKGSPKNSAEFGMAKKVGSSLLSSDEDLSEGSIGNETSTF